MAAFTPADLPASVNTVEKLAVWSISILSETTSADSITTARGVDEQPASAQSFRFSFQPTAPERLVLIAYVPLTAGWKGAGKLYDTGVTAFNNTAIPAYYKS